MQTLQRCLYIASGWVLGGLVISLLTGCEPLRQSYTVADPRDVETPVSVSGDQVWVSSIPAGAEVYLQPLTPGEPPSHSTSSDDYKGKTPLQLTIPPGTYWIELALNAEVFSEYFSAPYENVQFENDGAVSEALLFRPFDLSQKRRVLRYYRLAKEPDQGEMIIALFHPRGVPLNRVEPLYPREAHFDIGPDVLPALEAAAEASEDERGPLLDMLRRGGKVVWTKGDDYRVALEVGPDGLRSHINTLYQGSPHPSPLLPDGGGL